MSFLNALARLFRLDSPTVTASAWGSEFGYAPATQEELDAWNAQVQPRNQGKAFRKDHKRWLRRLERQGVQAGYRTY